jgi:hypothetical protein
MALMTPNSDCEYPLGRGGIRPFLKTRVNQSFDEGGRDDDAPNEYAELRVCLGFVERGFECA